MISTQISDTVPALQTEDAAHHYRFVGVLIRRHPSNTADITALVALSYPGEAVLANVPHHLIFDRCIFSNIPFDPGNPNPSTDLELKRGIQLGSGSTSFINSYFREFKFTGADSQAIACWAGTGPHAIINNFLEGATENIMYGGSSMRIQYATPSDITIRDNYFFKPLRWATDSAASVKNIFELKHAKNVVFDGNVLQNSFVGGQGGTAVVLTVRNQENDNPWSIVENVQMTNNKIDNVGRGLNITTFDDESSTSSLHTRNLIIRNNLFDRVGAVLNSDGVFLKIGNLPAKLWIDHNTVFHTGTPLDGYGAPLLTADSEFRFNNNILQHHVYGFRGDGEGINADGLGYLNTYAPGWQMRRNVMVFPDDKAGAISNYPFPANINNAPTCPVAAGDLKLNKYLNELTEPYNSLFIDRAKGDLRLSAVTYGGRQWATDCTDVGVNLSTLQIATAGARAGFWAVNSGDILLADDFNDAARDTFVWAQGTIYGNSSSVVVNEQNNRLEITSPAGSGAHWSGYDSIYSLDFSNSHASVEVPQVVGNEGGETWLFVYQDSSNYFRIGVRRVSGTLTLQGDKISGGSIQNVVSTTYSASSHRWWRIRHQTSNNTVVFETSANGNTWGAQSSVANHLTTTALKVSVGAGKIDGSASASSTAHFNNLKVNK